MGSINSPHYLIQSHKWAYREVNHLPDPATDSREMFIK